MTNVDQTETDAIPSDDTREKLEADVRGRFTHRTSTAMWPPSANKVTDWVSVSMETVLGWLDRQAEITEREVKEANMESWRTWCNSLGVSRTKERAGEQIAEMQAKVDELTLKLQGEREAKEDLLANWRELLSERDELQTKLEAFEGDCYCGATVVEWHEMTCKLQDKVDELAEERDEWKMKCETREVAYKQADAERKRYSEQIDELIEERDSAYMRLPVDADGVPIKPGDTIRRTTSAVDNVVTVIGVNEKEFFFNGPNFTEPGIKKNTGNAVRHVQPDTVDSILREFTDAVLEWASQSGPASEVPTWAEMSSEYIERIRKALDRNE